MGRIIISRVSFPQSRVQSMTRMRKQSKLQIANTACSTLNILNNDLTFSPRFYPLFVGKKTQDEISYERQTKARSCSPTRGSEVVRGDTGACLSPDPRRKSYLGERRANTSRYTLINTQRWFREPGQKSDAVSSPCVHGKRASSFSTARKRSRPSS